MPRVTSSLSPLRIVVSYFTETWPVIMLYGRHTIRVETNPFHADSLRLKC